MSRVIIARRAYALWYLSKAGINYCMTGAFGGPLVPMGQKPAQKPRQFQELMVSSPCTAACSLDDKREYCTGCYRTIDEIMEWSRFTGEKKHQVNKAAAERRAAAVQTSPR